MRLYITVEVGSPTEELGKRRASVYYTAIQFQMHMLKCLPKYVWQQTRSALTNMLVPEFLHE